MTKTKQDLSIIILNYNTKELLKNCLQSIYSIKDKLSFEVIVADNGSHDGSLEMVKNDFHKVKVIDNEDNLGFAAGNNRGVPLSNGRFVLFLNSDTIVPSETLDYMVKFMDSDPSIGISTCQIDLKIGGLDLDSHRGFPTPWNSFCYFSGLAKIFPKSRVFNGYHLGHLDLKSVHEIDACVGAFLMIRREIGDKLKWWDEDYFFYGEDLDLCFRAKQLGYKIMYNPNVKIIHYKGASSGVRKESARFTTATDETRRRVAKASVDAMRVFYKKHYSSKYPYAINWFMNRVLDLKYQLRLRGIR